MNTVVFGDLAVTLTDRHGARVTRVPLRPEPRPTRLSYGPGGPGGPGRPGGLAPPFVVGREEQRGLVRGAIRERSAMEFTGPCGAGKTTLLRDAAVGGAYVRVASIEPEDLLQDLMRQFYVYPLPDGRRLTTRQCGQALGHVSGVVVLDDVSYRPDQLGHLRRVLPGCALVIGAAAPVLGALGTSYALPGLSESAAVALLSRELGRTVTNAELPAVRRLVAAVDGQPLHLRQAGALVRSDGRSFADLARRAESDPNTLDELSISAVGLQAKRVLAVLTLFGGALLPAGLLAQMADIAYVGETFESLFTSGLAEQREDRFGLPVCKCESYRQILYRHIGLATVLRSLVSWLASGDPTGEDARGAVDAALSLLGIAAERREWEVVSQLVTAVERVLFVQGHWQAWQHALAQGITAAQGLGDKAAEAYFSHQQGVQHFLHDRTDDARRLLQRALDLRTQLGDTAGAAVTAANLALLEPVPVPVPAPVPAPPPPPPGPSAGPGNPRSWRRVLTAVAAVVAVLVIGTAIGQALGGFGGGGGGHSSSPPVDPGSGGGMGGGSAAGQTTVGQTTLGQTTVGQTTVGQTTTGRTTEGDGGTSPIALAGPEITPSAKEFGLTHTFPSVEAPIVDFTVTNPNDRAIELGSPTFPGEGGFSYADGTCADRLEAKASCTVSVEFSPSHVGPATGQLAITSGGRPFTAALTGTGFASLTVRTSGAANRTVTITDSRAGQVCEIEAGLDISIPTESKPCVVQITARDQKLTATISDTSFGTQGWSGACTSDTDTCVPTIDRDTDATVAFAPLSRH